MRCWRILGLLLLLAAALSGCGPGKEYTYRIAVIPKGLTHEFWQSIHRGALRAASDLEEQGTPTDIIWDGPLRERDALAQIRIVDRRISTHVNGIVLAPQHSQTMVAPVERAVEQGIPVLIIDSGLDKDVLKKRPDLIVKYVATNNYKGGWLAAEHLLKIIAQDPNHEGDTANLILFRYAVGSESTEQREQGFEDYVAAYQKGDVPAAGGKRLKINWLSNDKYAGATTDSAQREASPLLARLRKQRIDGIFAPNESSADGMLQSLRSMAMARRVRLMGFDSSAPLLDAVRSGDMVGLILQDPYKMGYLGTWTLVRRLKGEDVTDGGREREVSTGEHVITKDNVDTQDTKKLFDPDAQAARPSAELREGNPYRMPQAGKTDR
jgi:ribose transport system substrate-binding protein